MLLRSPLVLYFSKGPPMGGNCLEFFAKGLCTSEAKYSAFDRELLALYLAIRHFCYFVEGRTFAVLTDHKPLIRTIASHSDRYSLRQQHHFSSISEITTDTRHVSGVENVIADALLRGVHFIHSTLSTIDYSEMATAQQDERDGYPESSQVVEFLLQFEPDTICCAFSTSIYRPIVPLSCRRRVFDSLHSLEHPGLRATLNLIATRFVRPGMNEEVRAWAKSCL